MHLNEASFIWFVVYYIINMLWCSLAFLRFLSFSYINLFVSVLSYTTVLL